MEAYAIPNQEASTVANKLVDEMFCRFSLPEQLHSDQGQQFKSILIQEMSKTLQIRKTRTTPYHPQSDGLIERFNRTLLSMLSTTVQEHPWDWEDSLRKVCLAYNSSVHPGTGYTPFYLMFGRQARLPVDVAFGTAPQQVVSHDQYAANLRQTLEEAYQTVRTNLGAHLQRQKEIYDRKVHGQPFEKGDMVWLHTPAAKRGKSRKLVCPWAGPYVVVKKLSEVTYRVQHSQDKRRRTVVHFDRLKPCPANIRVRQSTAPTEGTPPLPAVQRRNNVGDHLELCEPDDVEESAPPFTCYPNRLST